MSSTLTDEFNWKQILLDYQGSKLSMKDFCQVKGLRYHQFYHYKRKLAGKKTPEASYTKVKVVDRSPAKEPPRIIIYFNEVSLALKGDQDLDLIAKICHKLGQE
jgi:hypothetical protein